MSEFIPESKQLMNRRAPSGWDTHHVCKTLIVWYPEILQRGQRHADLKNSRRVMLFLSSIQEYPSDLQDLLILLGCRHGFAEAQKALDNAVRKYLTEKSRPARRNRDRSQAPAAAGTGRLTA